MHECAPLSTGSTEQHDKPWRLPLAALLRATANPALCPARYVQVVKHGTVTCIGYTDMPSRLPAQSSTLLSNNISKVGRSEGREAGGGRGSALERAGPCTPRHVRPALLLQQRRRREIETESNLCWITRVLPFTCPAPAPAPPSGPQFLLSQGPFTNPTEKDVWRVDHKDDAVR